MFRSAKCQQIKDSGLVKRSLEGLPKVRVHVKLTNAMDEGLFRRGFRTSDQIRRIEVGAMVDASAVQCAIPASLADQLGLVRSFTQTVQRAEGREDVVEVTEPVLLEIMNRKAYEGCLVLGDEILIGRTALASMDLFLDCRSRELVPNPAHPNGVVIEIRSIENSVGATTLSRGA